MELTRNPWVLWLAAEVAVVLVVAVRQLLWPPAEKLSLWVAVLRCHVAPLLWGWLGFCRWLLRWAYKAAERAVERHDLAASVQAPAQKS